MDINKWRSVAVKKEDYLLLKKYVKINTERQELWYLS